MAFKNKGGFITRSQEAERASQVLNVKTRGVRTGSPEAKKVQGGIIKIVPFAFVS